MESAAWGFIGTLLGAGASIATTYLTNRNAARLQSDAASVDRFERQKAFQRETLIELQDAFHDSIRLVAQIHLEDIHAHSQTGKWGKNQLPDELSERHRTSNRRVLLLVERVADDSVRTTIKGLMSQANNVLFSSSKDESEARWQRVSLESLSAIEKVGENLRSLY